ncbi:MAG: hypothetical protein R2681_08235 [Pyrinomonadaceae bacterium]
MTEIESKQLEEMKRFVFHELSGEEREMLEERFFLDEDFFYDLLELENGLVDDFARGRLKGNDLKRFEASLERSEERRQKVANAIALNSLIKEEKQTETRDSVVTDPTLWEKITAFFTFKLPAMQYAAAALLFLLLGGMSFLFYERVRLNQELANYREDQKNIEKLKNQERELQNKLNEIQQREKDLQKQIDNKEGEGEILNSQLESEKAEKQRLQNEIDRLKKLQENNPLPPQQRETPDQPPQPTIATVILSPFIGGRGDGNGGIKTVKLNPNLNNISVTLQFPKDTTAELFLVKFGGRNIASNRKPGTTKSGIKFITVMIPANQFSIGKENTISVFGNTGVSYEFILKVQK